MLSGEVVTAAVVSTLQTIPGLLTAMLGDPTRIAGHFYFYGVDAPLAEKIYQMTPPFVLIAYEAEIGGNFDGATLFKHKLGIYVRSANMSGGVINPTGLWNLWALICNGPVNGGTHNIRQVEIISTQLYMVDVPSAKLMTDTEATDYLCGSFVLNEEGDN